MVGLLPEEALGKHEAMQRWLLGCSLAPLLPHPAGPQRSCGGQQAGSFFLLTNSLRLKYAIKEVYCRPLKTKNIMIS